MSTEPTRPTPTALIRMWGGKKKLDEKQIIGEIHETPGYHGGGHPYLEREKALPG